MKIVFTYIPIRLDAQTKIYLNYSISNLNNQNIIPLIYSDEDYFKNTTLKYDYINIKIDEKYLKSNLWSYPKLKVLSQIDFPFIHLDNDLVIKNFIPTLNKIKKDALNLCYKHPINENKINTFIDIFKMYSNNHLNFDMLNNTSLIGTTDYISVNKSYMDVLNVIEKNYDTFLKKINDIPPITLNQQYVNLFFNEINYLFNENPSYNDFEKNGICHIAEKNLVHKFTFDKKII
jgi:hypothetical protein